jgi:hypothetical protein
MVKQIPAFLPSLEGSSFEGIAITNSTPILYGLAGSPHFTEYKKEGCHEKQEMHMGMENRGQGAARRRTGASELWGRRHAGRSGWEHTRERPDFRLGQRAAGGKTVRHLAGLPE